MPGLHKSECLLFPKEEERISSVVPCDSFDQWHNGATTHRVKAFWVAGSMTPFQPPPPRRHALPGFHVPSELSHSSWEINEFILLQAIPFVMRNSWGSLVLNGESKAIHFAKDLLLSFSTPATCPFGLSSRSWWLEGLLKQPPFFQICDYHGALLQRKINLFFYFQTTKQKESNLDWTTEFIFKPPCGLVKGCHLLCFKSHREE